MPEQDKTSLAVRHEALERLLIAAVTAVDVAAWNLWRERVPAWVTILLAVVLTVMLAAWFRARARRERVAWSFLAVGLLLIIGALVLFEEPEARVADGARQQGHRPTLVVDTADESVVAVRRRAPEAIGRHLDGTTLFEFIDVPKQRPSTLSFEVDIVSRRRGRLWMQRAEVRGCAERDGNVRCSVKSSTWDAAEFMSLGTTTSSRAITARRVAVVTPGNDCTPIAGKSLRAGADLFVQTERSIKIDSIPDDEWWTSVDPETAHFIALAGSYNSWATRKIIESCGRRCGPILTLSSAQSLRDGLAEPQSVFRLTSSNRRRAQDLVPLLEREFARLSRADSLHIVYNDDRATGAGDVHYAYDQAVELQDALKDNNDIPRAYWVRYQVNTFAKGDPRTNKAVPLPVSDFESLVAHLDERSPRSIVVFIDLDEKILEFGAALQRATNVARWYVPGPREIFDAAWTECLGGEAKRQTLEGVRVLSPDSKNTSVPAWKFAARWAEAFGNERVPWRAARMYDALTIINDAVAALDERLPGDLSGVLGDKLAFVHLDLYRERLREEIQRATLYGASGTIAFDRHGDMLADSYVAELGADGRLRPIAALAPEKEVAAPGRNAISRRLNVASTSVERVAGGF